VQGFCAHFIVAVAVGNAVVEEGVRRSDVADTAMLIDEKAGGVQFCLVDVMDGTDPKSVRLVG